MLDEKTKKYFDAPRKLRNVKAGDGYSLLLTFDNGENRVYDMEKELEGVFSVLREHSKFERVFIDEIGNVAWDIDENVDSSEHWNNRIDICKDAIYMNSKPIK